MKVCIFISADFNSTAVLREALCEKISYLAYMSRGCREDAVIKAFALSNKIESCPFVCSNFEQLRGMADLFDKCIVIRRNDDNSLEQLSLGLATIFRHVEIVCYNPVVARLTEMKMPQPLRRPLRKLSTITEE